MKYLIILIFCFLHLILGACKTIEYKSKEDNTILIDSTSILDTTYFKINEITSFGYAYILYAENNGKEYLILTQNDIVSNSLCHSPIKVGEKYSLKLEIIDVHKFSKERPDYDPEKFIPGDISGIIFNGTSISFGQFSKDLYTSPSLRGLCLLKDSYIPLIPTIEEKPKKVRNK